MLRHRQKGIGQIRKLGKNISPNILYVISDSNTDNIATLSTKFYTMKPKLKTTTNLTIFKQKEK